MIDVCRHRREHFKYFALDYRNRGLAIHQFSRAAQRGGSGRQDRTILTMRRRPLVNQEVRLRATFLG